ncbi:MAG: guanylate kinase [Clostridia bacterium]|nr:guanylate kinase [Clostridia bacterium]
MHHREVTFVISGPSGVGKGTICDRLIREMDGVALSVSCATRAPRRLKDGSMETDGVHYHFITPERFEAMIDEGDFYEYACVHSGYYGTSRSFVERQKEAGNDVILEIDMQGALQVKATDPSAVLIFILPPSYEELRRRLVGRQSETPEQVEKRLSDGLGQLAFAYVYDYIVVNDDLDEAVAAVADIIRVSRRRTVNNKKTLDDIKRSFLEVK